jgi:toxin YoeB
MGKFRIIIANQAVIDIKKHVKSGNKASINKIQNILKELEIHPTTGTGQPERLKHDLSGKWSRRINQKDRMIYSINDGTVTVEVLSAIGHYNDK